MTMTATEDEVRANARQLLHRTEAAEPQQPCCPCAEKKVLSTNAKINLAIFGANVGIGLILFIGGIVTLAKGKSKSAPKPQLVGTGIWLAIIGGIFVLTSLAPLIIAITAPRPTVRYPQADGQCRECACL